MNVFQLSNTALRGNKLALNSGGRKVKGGERSVKCDVLTVVDAPSATTNLRTSTGMSSSPVDIVKYIWSILAPSAQKLEPNDIDDIRATAAAFDTSQLESQVSTHVKTASRPEVKCARLMSDLSNMAYDVAKVTALSLLQRHKLRLVACSELAPPEEASQQPPAVHTVQSNIVPFPRNQHSDSMPANSTVQATFSTQQPTSPPPTAAPVSASLEGPLQWFVSDTLVQPEEPLRIIAIQGSVSWEHWKINLAFDPVDFESGEMGIKVHRGFYQAALDLYPIFLPYVLQHFKAHPSGKITLTGHSLGGSVATILMLLFVARGVLPPSAISPIHTFGAPAVFCDGANPGVAHCSSCQLSCSGHGNTNRHTNRKWSSCAGLLTMLGLPPSAVRNIVMHQDIVPRAFVCDYSQVAQLLQQCGPAFKSHSGLSSNQAHKILYNFIGTVHILQPDRRHKFVLGESYHHLLPAYPALYTVHGTDGCGSCDGQNAVLEFMNNPHPLEVLSSKAAYGTNGSISRYHNPDNYTKALFGILKRW